jgi:hypothetical protein
MLLGQNDMWRFEERCRRDDRRAAAVEDAVARER